MSYAQTCDDCGNEFDPGHSCPPPGGGIRYLQQQLKHLRRKLQESREETDRVCRFTNIGLADLRKKRNQAIAERDTAIEKRDGWKQLADFAVPRMEAAENAIHIGLKLLEQKIELEERVENTEEKQIALVAENEYLLEQIETLKEEKAVLKYWRKIKTQEKYWGPERR